MKSKTHYRLKRHHKFEHSGQKYVADLETGNIVQVSDVEWDLLSDYGLRTQYQTIGKLKKRYKLTSIFEAIERLERLGKQGSLLSPVVEAEDQIGANRKQNGQKPKLLVPFQFAMESSTLDSVTSASRYQLLTHLSKFAELETLAFPEGKAANLKSENIQNLGEIRVRNIEVPESDAFSPAWYAMDEYTGILLLSEFLSDDLSFYQMPDVPIVHYMENSQGFRSGMVETFLTLNAFQGLNDTLVVKSSWMKEWLAELGTPMENIQVIPDGIDVTAPIGDKALAKQYTAALFEKPIFTKQPVIGLISGFEPDRGAKWISAFARANPHLAIFVYDAMLERHYRHPPENVIIFSANDEETRSVLPIFFQALDLVCFPAMPGTPLSIVLKAMAFGAPCVAMTKYGMPSEVVGAGVAVESDWDHFGNFHVPMAKLLEAINHSLQPGTAGAKCKNDAESLPQRFTWEKTAQRIVELFKKRRPEKMDPSRATHPLFPPIFCRRYEPKTGEIVSSAYRLGMHRYDHLETALAEVLSEYHTPAEVESVFKHFQRAGSMPKYETIRAGNEFPNSLGQEINPAKKSIGRKEKNPNE